MTEYLPLFRSAGVSQRRNLRAMADYLGVTEMHLALRVAMDPTYYDRVLARMRAELAQLEELERAADRQLPEKTVIDVEEVEDAKRPDL